MADRLQHWNQFREEAFDKPYPTARKVKGWVNRGEIEGKIIGQDVYIYTDRFFREQKLNITDEAMRFLGG